MAKKQCTKCGIVKPYEQFSKLTKAKDGYQYHCKQCNNKDNQRFRDEIDPDYMKRWFNSNRTEWNAYTSYYSASDNVNKIYSITSNITGKVYIGLTRRKNPNFRFCEHKKFYKSKNKRLPLLFDSFDNDGIENHTFEVLHQFEGSRQKGLKMESKLIKFYKSLNKSLNVLD